MGKRALSILIGFSACIVASSHRATADDSCQMFLCMAGKAEGKGEAQGCSGYIAEYFSMQYQVWDPDFDPTQTASKRDTSAIGPCPGISTTTNTVLRTTITAIYGPLPADVP